jgi:hypothetical protein
MLQFITAREDDPDRYGAKIEKQTEIIQIPVIERVFVVPLQFQSNTILETINFMRGRFGFFPIHGDFSIEVFGFPSPYPHFLINPLGKLSFIAAANLDPAFAQPQSGQHVNQVGIFAREIVLQNCCGVPPLVQLVIFPYKLRQIIGAHSWK